MSWLRFPMGIGAFALCMIWYFTGFRGAGGFGIGLVASIFNLTGLWLGIRVFANQATAVQNGAKSSPIIVLLCFLKMPAFIVAGFLTWKIGGPAPASFMLGLLLVYSAMIWWAFKVR